MVQKTMNPGGPFGARWMRLSVPWGGYGIHGTNNPKSIGKAVSHGCIRMYNKDVIEIYDLTPIGTPVHTIGKNPGQRLLSSGMRGEDVESLQWQLKASGYLHGKIDGYFGRLTKHALIDFQRSAGLVPDGTAGPQTMQALQKALEIKMGIEEP
ncbi:L,D-transpeptidase family protein [Syntrophomonas palmitatica]|uniref:L,D-transpeptidase family protein n=1 Tax=Syntrophomonas palmitatica TaxID=402877 RepID=UPI001FA6F018|nr:peptidoglycan-binding protein [Syntrophomonas palmitatica]